MTLAKHLLFSVVLGLAASTACIRRDAPVGDRAADGSPSMTDGQGASLIGPSGVHSFERQNHPERAAVSVVKVEGQPFTEAIRAEVRARSDQPWDVQLGARTVAPVRKGDVLLATFYFRTEWAPQESGEGQTEFVFELAREPWTKSVSYPIHASREWRQVFVPFVAAESHPAGEAQMIFRLGYDRQIIDIGGVTVQNFKGEKKLAELPVTRLSYGGMEPDAPWRAAAQARIEKHRKADLTIQVLDRSGKRVPGAQVSVKLLRHTFGFGTCVPAKLLLSSGSDRFRSLLVELFSVATLENDLKWQPLSGDWGPDFTVERAQSGIAALRELGLQVRGHVLVWPGWRNLPKSLRGHEHNSDRLKLEVLRHIEHLASETRGKLLHWDVVNEPFDNHDLLDILGPEVMVDWFQKARQADPAAKLFINDYAILSGGGGTTPHRDHYEKTIELLSNRGAPFDGIGLQGHFGTSLTSPEDLLAILDRFAKFGKTLWVTEYDIVMDDLELAGSYTRDFYTTLFSHPAVGGIVMWGFWDGSHWKDNAPLYTNDFSIKPAGRAYRELLLDRWSTRATGSSDDQGRFQTRGFLGRYEIRVTRGDRQKTVKGTLASGGTELSVTLD